jgi:hypothetical protein
MEGVSFLELRLRRIARNPAKPERKGCHGQAGQQAQDRELHSAEFDDRGIQRFRHRLQQAQDIERGDQPGEQGQRIRDKAIPDVGGDQADDDPGVQKAGRNPQDLVVQPELLECRNGNPEHNGREDRPDDTRGRHGSMKENVRMLAAGGQLFQACGGYT